MMIFLVVVELGHLTDSRRTLSTSTRDIIRSGGGRSGSKGGGEVERVAGHVLEGGKIDENGFGELVELLTQFEHLGDEHLLSLLLLFLWFGIVVWLCIAHERSVSPFCP